MPNNALGSVMHTGRSNTSDVSAHFISATRLNRTNYVGLPKVAYNVP